MVSYYVSLFFKSLFEIPGSLGSNWLGLIFPAVVVLVGESIALVVYGKKAMIAKWKQATLIGFAALGVCYLVLFMGCAILTNYTGYDALRSNNQSLTKSVEDAGNRQKYAVLQAQLECARLAGRNESLESQNKDQQNSINGCLTQALRLIADTQMLKITGYFLGDIPAQYNPNISGKYHGSFIVLTNKTITPIRLLIHCDADITQVSGSVMGTGGAMGGGWGGRVTASQKEYGFGLLSPAWTAVNPILLTIYTDSANLGMCTFDEK